MIVGFPKRQPHTAAPLGEALIAVLGDLVRPSDAARIVTALDAIQLADVASIGLEITLPPAPSACDLSVLLLPGRVPAFVTHPSLWAFAAAADRAGVRSTWWEFDASSEGRSTGGFVQLIPGIDGAELCRAAVVDNEGLAASMDKVIDIASGFPSGAPGMLGFFPNRDPAAAAALIPIDPKVLDVALAQVGSLVSFATTFEDPVVQSLHERFPGTSLSVGVDAHGVSAASVEFSFGQPLKPMLDGKWRSALADLNIGPSEEVLTRLLLLEGVHDFENFLPLTVLSGIDHLKVMPDGRVKAYVGVMLFRRGVGVNAVRSDPTDSAP